MEARAPFVARLAGLPASTLDHLASSLPQGAVEIRRLASDLQTQRALLVDALFEALSGHDSDQRRLLLAVKRDAHNGRNISHRCTQAGWDAVELASGSLASRVAQLEQDLEVALGEFANQYRQERHRQAAALLDVAERLDLVRGVALSSPELIESTARLRQKVRLGQTMAGRKERKIEQSWLRYITRAAYKLSPYSTLSRLTLGEVDEASSGCGLVGEGWREHSVLRAKRYMVEELRDLLVLLPPVRDLIPRRLNPTLEWIEPARIRFLTADRRELSPTSELLYRQAALVRVGIRPELIAALEDMLASGPLPLKSLIPRWQERFSGADEAGIPATMVKIGLLMPCWPWNGNCTRLELELARYLGSQADHPELVAIAAKLLEVVDLEELFAATAEPAHLIRKINQVLAEAWSSVVELVGENQEISRRVRDRNDFYEDVFVSTGESATPSSQDSYDGQPLVLLGAENARVFYRDARLLVDLAELFNLRHDFLHQISHLAAERWPGREEVGVLELFSAVQDWWKEFNKYVAEGQSSFDWDGSFDRVLPQTVAELSQLRRRAWTAVEASLQSGPNEIRVDTAELAKFFAELPARYRPLLGGSYFVQPLNEAGAASWVLNRLFEGSGRYSSRYTTVMPAPMAHAYCERAIEGSRFELDGEAAELIDLVCPQGDTLNLRLTMTPRVIECAGEHATTSAENVLDATRLVVRLGEVPTLRDTTGKRLVPGHLGGVNLRFMPPLIKFLAYFGVGELRPLPWKRRAEPRGDVQYFPRLRAGSIAILRSRWKVPTAELKTWLAPGVDDAEAFLALDAWRVARELPRRAFLIEPVTDGFGNRIFKPQYLDFASPLCLDLFRQVVERGPNELELEELLPTPETLPVGLAGERWAVELQLDELTMSRVSDRFSPVAGDLYQPSDAEVHP